MFRIGILDEQLGVDLHEKVLNKIRWNSKQRLEVLIIKRPSSIMEFRNTITAAPTRLVCIRAGSGIRGLRWPSKGGRIPPGLTLTARFPASITVAACTATTMMVSRRHMGRAVRWQLMTTNWARIVTD